jgi:oxygen-independent coproporphyrinogen-3 oxidase
MIQYDCRATTQSLYIHWPFCPYKCHFCPFVAIASHDEYMEQYHKALITEIKSFAQTLPDRLHLKTIFFGGGTPSTYPDHLLLDTFATLKDVFDFDPDIEISIEVNPGTVRKEQLALWQRLGINRLSIGVQSLKDTVLSTLNRHQKAQDVRTLVVQAASLFPMLSVDLILGLPGVSRIEWQDTLAEVVTWPINHISIYFLTVHEETPLYFKVKTNRVTLPSDDDMVDTYHWTCNFLAQHDLQQYEISNFARANKMSKHNTTYWERKAYKGFGLGACSFDGINRLQNEKNLMRYMEGVEQGKNIIIFAESLTSKQIHLERLMLGLRRSCGISSHELLQELSAQEQSHFLMQKEVLIAQQLLIEKDGALALTPNGLVVENEVITKLIQ